MEWFCAIKITCNSLAGLSRISTIFSHAQGNPSAGEHTEEQALTGAAGAGAGSGATPADAALAVHEIAVPTNMVVFEVRGRRGEWSGPAGAIAFCEELRRRGVLMFPYGGQGERIRAVTHRHVDARAIDFVLEAVQDTLIKAAPR